MLPVLQIGPFSVQTPGLALLLALWIGLSLAERHSHKHALSPETLNSLALVALLGGAIGGRLGYILQYPHAFLQSPLSALSLNPGLFDPLAGLAAGLLSALLYGRRKALHFWKTLDALTPLAAVVAVGVALSHLASGNAFGEPTNLPWAIELWGARRHPSQIYEMLGSLLTLGLLWPRQADAPPGVYFLRFAALTSGTRLFLQAFRGDSALVLGGLRLEQILAWLALAAALGLLTWQEQKPQ